MYSIPVSLKQSAYRIIIEPHALQKGANFSLLSGRRVMIITNEKVAQHYLSPLTAALTAQQIAFNTILVQDGERYKNSETLQHIYTALLEQSYGRDTVILALGGGVIGDIAGFAAATYQRGIDLIQLPTTLLAQVDASIGGKTAINHPLGKNMIGAFHQPLQVIIDSSVLKTLPLREFQAGMAEVVKYALLFDESFLVFLERNITALMHYDENLLEEVIARCCQIKAKIVVADEHEKGERELLNLGHTFGHAIEQFCGYGNYLHGEAVAIGMIQAAMLSAHLGDLVEQDVKRIRLLLKRIGLPTTSPKAMKSSDYLPLMLRDKKARQGNIRLILLKKIGLGYVRSDMSTAEISKAIVASERD